MSLFVSGGVSMCEFLAVSLSVCESSSRTDASMTTIDDQYTKTFVEIRYK